MEHQLAFVVITICNNDELTAEVEIETSSMKEAEDFLEKYQGNATEANIFSFEKNPQDDFISALYFTGKICKTVKFNK